MPTFRPTILIHRHGEDMVSRLDVEDITKQQGMICLALHYEVISA